eukprot:TRINITY_DN17973_c0_g1_i1.p1 TRINITY_DN17973_c0_g1~~TRINITY_DN17973_c0_g1_i1.p1  ORF type:complete len:230 (+),score=44.20 TRINITY_DN17973_c0_g1_i1:31-720(+)
MFWSFATGCCGVSEDCTYIEVPRYQPASLDAETSPWAKDGSRSEATTADFSSSAFEVVLQLPEVGLHGLDLDVIDERLCIIAGVHCEGAAKTWNADFPQEQLQSMDAILQVDGKGGSSQAIEDALSNASGQLRLTLKRPKEYQIDLDVEERPLGIFMKSGASCKGIVIQDITEGGLLSSFNCRCPERAANPSDRIVEVQGLSEISKMKQALMDFKDSEKLRLKLISWVY